MRLPLDDPNHYISIVRNHIIYRHFSSKAYTKSCAMNWGEGKQYMYIIVCDNNRHDLNLLKAVGPYSRELRRPPPPKIITITKGWAYHSKLQWTSNSEAWTMTNITIDVDFRLIFFLKKNFWWLLKKHQLKSALCCCIKINMCSLRRRHTWTCGK